MSSLKCINVHPKINNNLGDIIIFPQTIRNGPVNVFKPIIINTNGTSKISKLFRALLDTSMLF